MLIQETSDWLAVRLGCDTPRHKNNTCVTCKSSYLSLSSKSLCSTSSVDLTSLYREEPVGAKRENNNPILSLSNSKTIICLPYTPNAKLMLVKCLLEKDATESVLWNYKTHVLKTDIWTLVLGSWSRYTSFLIHRAHHFFLYTPSTGLWQ